MNLSRIKEEIFITYKREFYLWLIGLLVFNLGLFLLSKEIAGFVVRTKEKAKIEKDFDNLNRKILEFQNLVGQVNFNQSFSEYRSPLQTSYEVTEIKQMLAEINAITSKENTYLIIHELSLQKVNSTAKILLTGEVVSFR